MPQTTLKANDRVKRAKGEGCIGTVKEVREEVTASSNESRERQLLINVQWDNGTLSCFSPEGLVPVTEG